MKIKLTVADIEWNGEGDLGELIDSVIRPAAAALAREAQAVREAAAEDVARPFADWLKARVDVAASARESTEVLHRDYLAWSESRQLSALGPKAFGDALTSLGFPLVKHGGARLRRGVRLK